MQIRAGQIYERDNVERLARRYGSALTQGLTIRDIQEWPEILQAITGEESVAAAERVFKVENSVTGWLRRPAQEVTQ
jgi:zinc protease